MGSFGERLRREREMRGITVEEIAEATKIGTRSLYALEQEQFDKLPGGIFNKGFVRAYARFLGIDEEQAVSDYLAATAENEPPSAAGSGSAPAAVAVEAGSERDAGGSVGASWRVVAAIIVFTVLAAGSWYGYNRWKAWRVVPAANMEVPPTIASTPPPRVEAKSVPAPPKAAPAELKPRPAPPATSTAPANAVILLHVRALNDAWMEVTADDKVIMSGVLPAAGEKVIRADRRVVLDIGNAGGVEITHNGKPLPPLGPEGKRRVLTVTPEGVQQ